jgi:hypothetical protein
LVLILSAVSVSALSFDPALAEGLGPSPRQITLRIETLEDAGGRRLLSETEHHAVLPVSFESALRVLSDLEGAVELFYNVTLSKIVDSPENTLYRHIEASYDFLGIGQSYSYIEEITEPLHSSEAYMIKSTLVESIDGKMNDYRGYWYVHRLPPASDGRFRTYVRLYSYIDYNEPFFLQDLILKLFADYEVNSMFSEVKDEATP